MQLAGSWRHSRLPGAELAAVVAGSSHSAAVVVGRAAAAVH